MTTPGTWTIDFDVRDDARRMFVPRDLLPDAGPGDRVTARSFDPESTHVGVVIDDDHDATAGDFVIVSFEDERR